MPNYVDENTGGLDWNELQVCLQHEHIAKEENMNGLLREDFDILVIIAKADKIIECPVCRDYISRAFRMPRIWWDWFFKGLNGYFGVEETEDEADNVDGYNTWAYFETKFYYGGNDTYVWHKLNMFSRWIPSTETMALIVFDPPGPIKANLPDALIQPSSRGRLKDPFWIYEGILKEILHLQDKSVWMIRDHVRAIEKNRALVTQPNPDYSHLHELARHAIHVSETLDTAATTVGNILQRHAEYMAGASDADKGQTRACKQLQDRLHFLEHMFVSLKHRSASNQARLQNEIQLSFNIVAQSDARTSVEIGRAAQKDSAAMKTVAFLTLTFLPATFISAIFSTSFFNFDGGEAVWTVSDKIWIYWAVAIPVTLFTVLLWYFWHRLFPQGLIGDRRGHSVESASLQII